MVKLGFYFVVNHWILITRCLVFGAMENELLQLLDYLLSLTTYLYLTNLPTYINYIHTYIQTYIHTS